MIISEDNYLAHYGVLRKSGRYPWGSGGPEYASNNGFLKMVADLKKEGMSEPDIAKSLGINTSDLRAAKSIAVNEERAANIARAQRLKEKGLSNGEIAKAMGAANESTVRGYLDAGAKNKENVLMGTSNMLRTELDKGGYLDIGTGVENHIGVSADKLSKAVAILKQDGYVVMPVLVDQLGTGPGNKTKIKVLAPPETTYKEIVQNKDKIRIPGVRSDDHGRTFGEPPGPPVQVDVKRVAINYSKKDAKGNEIGGGLADGVIYLRPGVADLSLGGKNYGQVRIAVNGTHYLKGMAMYKDDLPKGVDLQFNTNKTDKGDPLKAMKPINGPDKDPDGTNPFGATVKPPLFTIDAKGNKVRSAMNLVNEEGDWEKWNKNLSTQLLSKQSPVLAKQQLDMAREKRQRDLDEILALTNPAVRKKLLLEFADGADASAVHLKAAALPRQATQVILPVNTLKPSEIYAPNFRNGERVVLIRYPHGGTFEIPELTVNNNHAPAIKAIGQVARDAVGINAKVAERLSGADFDGDTVLVIPNNNNSIRTTAALERLKGFDPQSAFPPYDGMKTMGGGTWDAKQGKEVYPPGKSASGRTKGTQMGLVSNLITDMTIKGAGPDELARAVRHSMVVIDAEKHVLNWKQSEKDNGIRALQARYQARDDGRTTGGSSTLISRAKTPVNVVKRKPRSAANGGPIDRKTGELVYENVGKTFVDSKTGKVRTETQKAKRLEVVKDARTIMSENGGTRIENVYANHSNAMKAMANKARLEWLNTQTIPYSPSAKKAYAKEVAELQAGLNLARKNRPLERQAQLVANAQVALRRQANPDMDDAELKKIKGQELAKARTRVGAGKYDIDPTPQQWAAIQAGAISNHTLEQILQSSKPETIKELAMPRVATVLNSTSTSRVRSMLNSGYTQAEIAESLGISVSSVKTVIDS